MTSSAKGGPKVVRNIVAVAPSRLATSTEIHVGSTEDEVLTACGPFLDRESTQSGKMIVAGSIYGGLMAERDFPRAPPRNRRRLQRGSRHQALAMVSRPGREQRGSSATCRTGARRLRAEGFGVTLSRWGHFPIAGTWNFKDGWIDR
jgi:hypothetical protein